MRPIILYVAASIDGYIARPDGAVDWLEEMPNPDNSDFGYYDFYARVDTLIMGRKTYEEVLGFGVEWPYSGKEVHIVTTNSNLNIATPDTFILSGDVIKKLDELRKANGNSIWLVGGASLLKTCLDAELVDELIIQIIPIVLGEGIALFPSGVPEKWFQLKEAQTYDNGVVSLTWVVPK